jgi:hypothetical protein
MGDIIGSPREQRNKTTQLSHVMPARLVAGGVADLQASYRLIADRCSVAAPRCNTPALLKVSRDVTFALATVS